MEIRRFTDEYDAVAPLYGLAPLELRGRDRDRWIAIDRGEVVGAAEALLRPDNRLFVSFRGAERAAPDLGRTVAASLGHAAHASVEAGSALADELIAGGFSIELTIERFVVPFAGALQSLRSANPPSRYRLLTADQCDPDSLFLLDNDLRNLVAGTDGWAGNRTWFDEELTDPAAYWVAAERDTTRYVGLSRMWRNPTGPRFGLIGVMPQHRRPSPAPSLLRRTLAEAATWGHDSFTTETALTNTAVYSRLLRIGTPIGRIHQLVLDGYAGRRTP